mmetsp:Transcript_5332/g.12987  ORF Transcript_5332/g.12987 Transcript_5332/m.12987 type:complete len:82 (-) Transcript_5332:136-381(-)
MRDLDAAGYENVHGGALMMPASDREQSKGLSKPGGDVAVGLSSTKRVEMLLCVVVRNYMYSQLITAFNWCLRMHRVCIKML